MGHSRAEDLALLMDAAAEAGAIALGYFGRTQRTWTKGVDSIVGEADIAVDLRLAEILREARPAYGWLSEETVDTAERLERERVFVVDPIDGTRGFIAGGTQWTVSLAVVEKGRPVVGVLAAPALEEILYAVAGEGAFRNAVPLAATSATDLVHARFAGPRRYARTAAVVTGVPAEGMRFVPSLAYRLALVATGQIDVAVARGSAKDWDLAAADLLVQEAGARVTDFAGGPLRYNLADPSHPALIATTPALFGQVADIVRRADSEAG